MFGHYGALPRSLHCTGRFIYHAHPNFMSIITFEIIRKCIETDSFIRNGVNSEINNAFFSTSSFLDILKSIDRVSSDASSEIIRRILFFLYSSGIVFFFHFMGTHVRLLICTFSFPCVAVLLGKTGNTGEKQSLQP